MTNAAAIIIGAGSSQSARAVGLKDLSHSDPAAVVIADYARRLGYTQVEELIGPNAKYKKVDDALQQAAAACPAWDTVLIVFSGHGYRMDAGLKCDHYDDMHWCLDDAMMVDHHLLSRTQRFSERTRLFILADCCFAAGGSGRDGMPKMVMAKASAPILAPSALPLSPWEKAVEDGRAAVRRDHTFNCEKPKAETLLFAAADEAPAPAGVFMGALLQVWQPGVEQSFRDLHGQVLALVLQQSANTNTPRLIPANSPLLDAPAFVP
ncbi:MAG TPA: caspase family protein [Longimicrobiaceae bacterium]|nr:caspase family protein [Longimicrobiaceae bacterium]